MLPSVSAGWDKWQLVTFIEQMSTEEHPVSVIHESITGMEMISDSFVKHIVNRIKEKSLYKNTLMQKKLNRRSKL